MKKQLALIITLFIIIGTNTFAQGYAEFVTSKRNVYDEFTTPGTGVVAPGDVTATFLWAMVGTSDPLGAGTPTTGAFESDFGWSTIDSMLLSGWSIAQNYNEGSPIEVDVADNASGINQGAIVYNSALTFQLANAQPGSTYELVVIGWDNLGGDKTLEAAAADGVTVGWSGAFNYMIGATSGATVNDFSESGELPFGVPPIMPEPGTLALAGIGSLSLFLFRRRKLQS